uniref:Uncharacterized protein n=1 Tax=Eutreptiella gymnastica TaxID=73025 RepID=A0A7S4FFK3_9EUGL
MWLWEHVGSDVWLGSHMRKRHVHSNWCVLGALCPTNDLKILLRSAAPRCERSPEQVCALNVQGISVIMNWSQSTVQFVVNGRLDVSSACDLELHVSRFQF